MRSKSPALMVAGIAALAVVLLVGAALLWLYASAPAPRDAPGWSVGPPLPDPRGELATAVAHARPCPTLPCPADERLFVLGGLSGLGRVSDGVSSYDPKLGRWTAAPPLPGARHHLGAAGLGEAVYVSGGTATRLGAWRAEPNFWRLPVGAERWEVLPPMPESRWGHRLVPYEDRLYVVGGQGSSSRVLIYSAAEGWRIGAEMPAPRDHLSAAVAAGRIWAIGGRAPHSLARVDVYDPAADRWEPGPELPAPTSGAAEGVIDGVIFVFGGEEPGLFRGRVFDRHWQLDTRAPVPSWQPAPAPPLAVHGADGAVFNGQLVIVGGASRHGLLSVTSWTGTFQRLDLTANSSPAQGAQ